MTAKEELHDLVEKLPDSELATAQRFLRYLYETSTDPLLRPLMNAPSDDELETEEERSTVQEAKQEIARGEVYSWEEIRAKLRELERLEAEGHQKAS